MRNLWWLSIIALLIPACATDNPKPANPLPAQNPAIAITQLTHDQSFTQGPAYFHQSLGWSRSSKYCCWVNTPVGGRGFTFSIYDVANDTPVVENHTVLSFPSWDSKADLLWYVSTNSELSIFDPAIAQSAVAAKNCPLLFPTSMITGDIVGHGNLDQTKADQPPYVVWKWNHKTGFTEIYRFPDFPNFWSIRCTAHPTLPLAMCRTGRPANDPPNPNNKEPVRVIFDENGKEIDTVPAIYKGHFMWAGDYLLRGDGYPYRVKITMKGLERGIDETSRGGDLAWQRIGTDDRIKVSDPIVLGDWFGGLANKPVRGVVHLWDENGTRHDFGPFNRGPENLNKLDPNPSGSWDGKYFLIGATANQETIHDAFLIATTE